jgi:hypothetical protein
MSNRVEEGEDDDGTEDAGVIERRKLDRVKW